jgi:hypothetical protein
MRKDIIEEIRKSKHLFMSYGTVKIFGGLVRRSILSDSMIHKHLPIKGDLSFKDLEKILVPKDTFVSVNADIDLLVQQTTCNGDNDDNDELILLMDILSTVISGIKTYEVTQVYRSCQYMKDVRRFRIATMKHPVAESTFVYVDLVPSKAFSGM